VRCNTTARWKASRITAAAGVAIDGGRGRVMLRARTDAGSRPLVSGALCRYDDRLCHSIRSFSVAVLRRLGAGGSLRKHRTRRPASQARYSFRMVLRSYDGERPCRFPVTALAGRSAADNGRPVGTPSAYQSRRRAGWPGRNLAASRQPWAGRAGT
jgi:hypothetical protein